MYDHYLYNGQEIASDTKSILAKNILKLLFKSIRKMSNVTPNSLTKLFSPRDLEVMTYIINDSKFQQNRYGCQCGQLPGLVLR